MLTTTAICGMFCLTSGAVPSTFQKHKCSLHLMQHCGGGKKDKKNVHIPIFNAAFPLTAQVTARLFGPVALCDSVAAGLIQLYCDKM